MRRRKCSASSIHIRKRGSNGPADNQSGLIGRGIIAYSFIRSGFGPWTACQDFGLTASFAAIVAFGIFRRQTAIDPYAQVILE